MTPDLSVIIPIYNQSERIMSYSLESVRRASDGMAVETIVVDDGSSPRVAESLGRLGFTPTRLIEQPNHGLLFARLIGFQHANGRYALFLDSDDLVSSDKFRAQVSAMDEAQADVSYTDVAHAVLEGDYDKLRMVEEPPLATTNDAAELYIKIQPAPHGPIFRSDYLRDIIQRAYFPPSPLYNCVAEIWFYHNAAPRSARVVKVPGPHTIGGRHPGVRLTNHWERLGVASLAVLEAFVRSCPDSPEARHAREMVGEATFLAWRKLPHGCPREFDDRLLNVWRRLPKGSKARLGGRGFQSVAAALGPVAAGRLLRRWQRPPYSEISTISDGEFTRLLRALPAP